MSKIDQARTIYNENKKFMTRKLILCEFLERIDGMTLSYASRCFNLVKDSGGAYKPRSKFSKATSIYTEMIENGASRSDIIASFMNDVKLTKNGAETYFNIIKRNTQK